MGNNNFRRPGASTGPASFPSGVDMQRGAPISNSVNEDHEENIMFLNKNPGGIGNRHSIPNGPTTASSAPSIEEPPNDFKNKQIHELTDMVKILLEEQRALKTKLEQQELKMRESGRR